MCPSLTNIVLQILDLALFNNNDACTTKNTLGQPWICCETFMLSITTRNLVRWLSYLFLHALSAVYVWTHACTHRMSTRKHRYESSLKSNTPWKWIKTLWFECNHMYGLHLYRNITITITRCDGRGFFVVLSFFLYCYIFSHHCLQI